MERIVIFDIDETISTPPPERVEAEKRARISGDWTEFYDFPFDKDEPIEEMLRLATQLWFTYRLVFITGRTETVRADTVRWLDEYIGTGHYELIMRPISAPLTPCEILKPKLFLSHGLKVEDVAFAIDDKPEILRAWRAMGIETTLQIGGKV